MHYCQEQAEELVGFVVLDVDVDVVVGAAAAVEAILAACNTQPTVDYKLLVAVKCHEIFLLFCTVHIYNIIIPLLSSLIDLRQR